MPQEQEAYRMGYERQTGRFAKSSNMLIQLVTTDSNVFKESILQNSKETVELRKNLYRKEIE